MIPLIKPYITEEIKEEVARVLDSGYLTEGPVTHELEGAFRKYIGCSHAIAVCNCTVGLEMALRVLGIGPGDEVIVPDYTYPATASVVNIVGAAAVLVDVDPNSMLIDYTAMEEAVTERTRAAIPVSLFGNPLDWDQLRQIKEKHGIYIIEDAACSIGAEYKDTKVGYLADISVFSLHPRKFITTGEGGMVTTSNPQWAQWMESYKHFGMGTSASREGMVFERIGTNYKLSNILAAVGLVQMEHVHELLDRRIALSERYIRLLRDHPNIAIQQTTPHGKHSRQSFCTIVNNRDEIMRAMRAKGIEAQIGTYALHMHPAYAPSEIVRHHGQFPGSRDAYAHTLALPLFHEMTEDQQDVVVKELIAESVLALSVLAQS